MSYHNMPFIAPRGSRVLSRIEDKVPTGIAYVHPYLYTLTSTITVMVAAFRLEDDREHGLEAILNQDLTTQIERQEHSFSILSVGLQKDRAADAWRDTLRREASCWLAERFPGSFHKLAPGELPTIELLITGQYRPWEPVAHRSDTPEWVGILDIDGWFGCWQSQQIASLRLSERHARAQKSDRYTFVLGTTERELLENPRSENLSEAIAKLERPMSALLVRWSLSALVRELEEQLPSILDAADRTSRKPSTSTVDQLQQQLRRVGLDIRIVVNDIVSYTQNSMWVYEVPDFTRVISLGRGPTGEPVGTLTQWLRQTQADDGHRLLRVERDLSEVLNTNVQLTAASANLRLARTQKWVAVVAALAAIAAVVIALWPHPSNPTPAQRPQTGHTALHSPPTPSTKPQSTGRI